MMKKSLLVSLIVLLVSCARQSENSYERIWKSVIKPGESVFEVSGSTYAWEMHDEGIKGVLDNMQNIACVNSVYLIALMHHETRPYTSDQFPKNPVRKRYFSEDSRIYWHPDTTLYGRIKPQLSERLWLQDTDWLQVLVDEAHARGIKAGVEISHTILSNDFLSQAENQDLVQRNLYGEPALMWGNKFFPCPNNPDVREFLAAIYRDLATNYKVDYIQTCMVNFVWGEAATGGCFCKHCISAASKEGIDLKAIIEVLKNNPEKEPEKSQWLEFRRNSCTEQYKMIADIIKACNPDIDFRLNHFNRNAEQGGLFIEDVAPFLGSMRVMDYSEQYGDKSGLEIKREWLNKARQRVGPDLPILSAVAVRPKAYPDIIVKGIQTALESDIQGITLGHYDGSTFSMLRAVRTGLLAGGVKGIVPVMGKEDDIMDSYRYRSNWYVFESCSATDESGTAKLTFEWPDGQYNIKIYYADAQGGSAVMKLLLNGAILDEWVLDMDTDCWLTRTIPGVKIKNGDEVMLVGKADGEDWARFDFIEFVKN